MLKEKMIITDQDIDLLVTHDDLNEVCQILSEFVEQDVKYFIINLLLFLFYSKETTKVDWIQDIKYVLNHKLFNQSVFAPCVEMKEEILQNISTKIKILDQCGFIEIDDYKISYDMFNSFIDSIFKWCTENFGVEEP